jgi:electron transfer flavoprotein beta subunit
VVTVVKQINEPRFPGMRNVLKAKKAQITKWSAADINADLTQTGFDGSPTTVIRVWPPERRSGGTMLAGSTDEVVEALAKAIKELNIAVGG